MEVCAIRIDERLIHGQVAGLWQGNWDCNRILVIDADSANDPVMKSVLKMACPYGVKLSILEAEKAAANLRSGKYGQERVALIAKAPGEICALIDNGYRPECDITVGNMSYAPGKRRVSKNISVSEEDVENFRRLNDLGCRLSCQMVPSAAAVRFLPMMEQALEGG